MSRAVAPGGSHPGARAHGVLVLRWARVKYAESRSRDARVWCVEGPKAKGENTAYLQPYEAVHKAPTDTFIPQCTMTYDKKCRIV